MKYVLLLQVCLVCLSSSAVGQDLNRQVPDSTPAFVGRWEVVSVIGAGQIVPDTEHTLCISESFLAEYANMDSLPGLELNMHNVRWEEANGMLRTRLYANPAKSVGLDRFAKQNTAAYCYLKMVGDSGVMLITEFEMEGDQIDLAFADVGRIMSIRRVKKDPGQRLAHAKKFLQPMPFRKLNELGDYELRLMGGWLEELNENGIQIPARVEERDSSPLRLVPPSGVGRQ